MKKTSIGVCNECGEDIIVGEKYVCLDGYKYHRECLEEISVEEWLSMMGENIKEADYSDLYDDEERETM